MFTCGYVLKDGSQCLHVSRRKALACVDRGRLVDFANQCNAQKNEALENLKRLEIAATNSENERNATIAKLTETLAIANTKMDEATGALKSQNDFVDKLQKDIKIITEERDALAQAAIHTAQHKEEILQEAAVTT